MTVGRESLVSLIEDPGLCPFCSEYDCEHQWYGQEHYRIGDDPAEKHPLISRRDIPAPRRIYSPEGQLLFAEGGLMAAEEAIAHGVAVPGQPGPPRPKGRRRRP